MRCQTELTDLDLKLPCGHTANTARCWQAQEPKSIRCAEMVTRTVPGCGHLVEVRCSEDVTTSSMQSLLRVRSRVRPHVQEQMWRVQGTER